MHPPIDDGTARYILETRRPFEDLRQVSAQLAGFLVLAASGAGSAAPDHPLLAQARDLHRSAIESLGASRPTECALAHHRCLVESAGALDEALNAAREPAVDPILRPLRLAYSHLQRASNELPGFEIVAFEQGCCAKNL